MHLQMTTVRENTRIIRSADKWQVLAFKESLKIKDKRPFLNNRVRAAKNLSCSKDLTPNNAGNEADDLLMSGKWKLIRRACI